MVLLIFIFGLIIGSFLNAVIYRLHSNESILERNSHCPYCKHKLAGLDLIPVLSFFLLGRRCRYCRKPISWQYPLVELVTAVAFVLIFVKAFPPPFLPHQWGGIEGGGWIQLLFQFVFVSFLIIIFVYDLKHYLILDKIVLPAATLAAIYQIGLGEIWTAFLGALLLSGFFALLYVISKGTWIGAGDIKLAAFLGLLIPYPQTLVVFFLAYLAGALLAIILIAARRKSLHDRLPFGTFLTFGAFFAILWGEELLKWYFRLIGIRL